MMADCELYQTEFTKVVDGILGSEGPVFTKDGNFYLVSPSKEEDGKPAGEILTVNFDNNSTECICRPRVGEDGGIPAGLQCDKHSNLWVADMRLGILKVTSDHQMTQVARIDDKGETMQGCNDCSFDYEGNLWVTAPAGQIAPAPYVRSSDEPFGSVYCLTRGGVVKKVASGFLFSNGLAVQHTSDGKPKTLIVAETMTKSLWAYDIIGPGTVNNSRLWGKLPGDLDGGPDGMDFDETGNLLVANWGQGHIEVFAPSGGSPHCRIKCPFSKPSNIHFKPHSNVCFVTEHDSHGLWCFKWKANGREEYCQL